MYRKNLRLPAAIPDWKTLERLPASERGADHSPELFKRIAREQVDRGVLIAKDLAGALCAFLQRQLLMSCEPRRTYVSLMSSEELVRRYSADTFVQVELGFPGHGPIYCLWDYSFAQACINRLTGGPGEAQIENEDLTSMEKSVLENVLYEVLACHSRSWRSVVPAMPQRISMTAPKLTAKERLLEKNECVMLSVELQQTGPAAVQVMHIIYDVESYGSLVAQWQANRPRQARAIQLSPEAVSMVDVPVKAELGKAIVSMADLMLMQRGDVIVLDKYINEPVHVSVGTDARFLAQAGMCGAQLAVQLLKPLSNEEPVAVVPAGDSGMSPARYAEDEGLLDPEGRAERPKASMADEAEESTAALQEGTIAHDDVRVPEGTDDDDILSNIEDEVDEEDEDEEFVWDENESTDEDF